MTRTPALLIGLLHATTAAAQQYRPGPLPGEERSTNIRLVSHLPPVNAGVAYSVSDIEIEQELSRPYAYMDRTKVPAGFDIISLREPAKPYILWSWRIENPELHRGDGSVAPAYVKTHGRYYFFNGFQFRQGGPDVDLGAIVWDVTGLPDTSAIREVARLRVPEHPGGFHETFAYKHSNGMALVVSQTMSEEAYLWDVDKIVSQAPDPVVGKAVIPDYDKITHFWPRWHDFYVGYDPATRQDKLYAAGGGGGYVFDISNPAEPRLIASITGAAGITGQHTFTPTPDGRYAVVMPLFEDYYAPARIFDLKPMLDGSVKTLSRPIGAWNASPAGTPHYSEVRWPYVFIAGQTDGFQVMNLMDPTNPYTVGYYATRPGPYRHGEGMTFARSQPTPDGRGNSVYDGGWGVDVRNADGLIVISDFDSGFWAFRMDGFDGWNGHQWGMPNVSSAQDWDHGPDGAPKPGKVS